MLPGPGGKSSLLFKGTPQKLGSGNMHKPGWSLKHCSPCHPESSWEWKGSANHTRKRRARIDIPVKGTGNNTSWKRKCSSGDEKWPTRVEKAETQHLKRWVLARNKMTHSWSTKGFRQKVLCKLGKGLRAWTQMSWCFMNRTIRRTSPHSAKTIVPPVHLQEWGIYSLQKLCQKGPRSGTPGTDETERGHSTHAKEWVFFTHPDLPVKAQDQENSPEKKEKCR